MKSFLTLVRLALSLCPFTQANAGDRKSLDHSLDDTVFRGISDHNMLYELVLDANHTAKLKITALVFTSQTACYAFPWNFHFDANASRLEMGAARRISRYDDRISKFEFRWNGSFIELKVQGVNYEDDVSLCNWQVMQDAIRRAQRFQPRKAE